MAKGRMLKKIICTSKKLASLKTDSARLLYSWLLPHLDIEGRFPGDPNIIKGHIFPRLNHITKKKIETYLQDLVRCRLIVVYKANDDVFLQFTEFHKHQYLRKDREAESDIPAPENGELLYNDGSYPAQYKLSLSKDKLSKDKEKYTKLRNREYIFLTYEEHQKLIDKFGFDTIEQYTTSLNDYIGSKGKRYKSHYSTILVWLRKDGIREKKKETEYKTPNAEERTLETEKKVKDMIHKIKVKKVEDV